MIAMRIGKCSIFGGPNDTGMTKDEGLALYEHHEADERLDLFNLRSVDASLGTSQRLRADAYYFAYRFVKETGRANLQETPWMLKNPRNGRKVVVSLCDWGPHERTGREFDISPAAASALGVKTDDIIQGWSL